MSFDAEKIRDEIVQWIRDWFEENGKGCKAVVGLSGGKDSSVVAALCVEALGKENVFGVMMPNGEQFDIDVSHKLAERCRSIAPQSESHTRAFAPQACGASWDREHRGQYKGCI